ncbi:hypothetical protein JW964_14990, partial [candidate division KSB1 bacterium]|nr:hypothetical protein [candidate division KSB1 bacterium]
INLINNQNVVSKSGLVKLIAPEIVSQLYQTLHLQWIVSFISLNNLRQVNHLPGKRFGKATAPALPNLAEQTKLM